MAIILIFVLLFSSGITADGTTCFDVIYHLRNNWTFPSGPLAPNQNCTITFKYADAFLAEITASGSGFIDNDQIIITDSFNNQMIYNESFAANFVVPPSSFKLSIKTAESHVNFGFHVSVRSFKLYGNTTSQYISTPGNIPTILNVTAFEDQSIYSLAATTKVVLSSKSLRTEELENIFVYENSTMIGTLRSFAGNEVKPTLSNNIRLFTAKSVQSKAFVVANDYENVKSLLSYDLYIPDLDATQNGFVITGGLGRKAATVLNDGPMGSGMHLQAIYFSFPNINPTLLNSGGPVANTTSSPYFLEQYTPEDVNGKLPRNFYGKAWTFTYFDNSVYVVYTIV